MKANFKLLESQAEINKKIVKQLATSLNSAVMGAVPTIASQIKNLVRTAITSAPEYNELSGGSLQAELGVPSSESRLARILDVWLGSMQISKKPVRASGNRIVGGISISMIKDDFSDVLGTAEASYTTAKGIRIPWLRWLLIAGDETKLVADYVFTEDTSFGNSRTGLGLMRSQRGGRWHVPREFAGTIKNNFVTRALSKLETQVINIMQTEIAKRLK
tara:strand:- start:2389 stop:3042 length:654 start_codon:yes stop_codon:yes gene_type:complete